MREIGLGRRYQIDSGSAECYVRDNLAKLLRKFELVLQKIRAGTYININPSGMLKILRVHHGLIGSLFGNIPWAQLHV